MTDGGVVDEEASGRLREVELKHISDPDFHRPHLRHPSVKLGAFIFSNRSLELVCD